MSCAGLCKHSGGWREIYEKAYCQYLIPTGSEIQVCNKFTSSLDNLYNINL